MSLFTELRRRNVIRVAVAYLVAAWLLLQIADVLMGVLGLPESVGKIVFLVLAIGFIPALVFAWAFEITPEGIKRDADVSRMDTAAQQHTARKLDTAVIVMLVAVGVLVVWDRIVPEPESGPEPQTPAVVEERAGPAAADELTEVADRSRPGKDEAPDSRTTPEPERPSAITDAEIDGLRSVAVLPFTNMSPDPDNAFFADGISEELLNVLVDLEGLRVPSRTSSFAFKGRNMDIRDIASQLQVDHILEGSVRKAGNQVRITAQLIDVSTDTHLWSETYDRELEDIFAIQDDIAGRIASSLGEVLEFDRRNDRPTDDLEAYTLYLQGRQLFQQREEGLREAERLLRRAVSLDPEFAEAWGTLAATCVNMPNYLRSDRGESQACTIEAAERALALDPSLAEPRLALAWIRFNHRELMEALALYEEVIDQHPRHALARLWYGVTLQGAGYLKEALEQYKVGAGLDPTYGLMLDWMARGYLTDGQLDRVVEPAVRAMQLGREPAGVPLVNAFMTEGNLDDVQRYLDTAETTGWAQVRWLFRMRDGSAQLDEALAWVESPQRNIPERIRDYHRMEFVLEGGSSAQAFEQIRAVSQFDNSVEWVIWSPNNRRHLATPAMKAWMRERGYIALWKQRGWPDLCRPVGADDFECDG